MKKVLKSRIFVAIITAIVCVTVTAYAATQILASNIAYKDTTVEDALNDLYAISSTFDFSNKTVLNNQYAGDRMANKSVSLNLEAGNYIIILNYGVAWGSSSTVNIHNNISKQLDLSSGTCISINANSNNKSASTKLDNYYYTEELYTSIYSCNFNEQTTISYVRDTSTYSNSPVVVELNAIKIK